MAVGPVPQQFCAQHDAPQNFDPPEQPWHAPPTHTSARPVQLAHVFPHAVSVCGTQIPLQSAMPATHERTTQLPDTQATCAAPAIVVQSWPHDPQFDALLFVSTHSPLGSVCDPHGAAPQQSVPLHVLEQPVPGEQNEKPASTQFWSHEPHEVFAVSADSQPSLDCELQSANPALQAPTAHASALSIRAHAASAFFGVGHALQAPPHPLLGRLMSTHAPAQSLVPGPQSDPPSLSVWMPTEASAPETLPVSLPRMALQPTMQPKGSPMKTASASRSRFTNSLAFRKTPRFGRRRRRARRSMPSPSSFACVARSPRSRCP